jgi:carbamoyl-phosphate synthase/aspartate carbamoyltransferase
MAYYSPNSRQAHRGPGGPIAAHPKDDLLVSPDAVLEFMDGSAFRGISFGAEGKSVAGECVFQTGQSSSLPF